MDDAAPYGGWGIGFASEAVVHEACRVLVPRRDYVVVSDPANPTYRWGNYLMCATVTHDVAHLESAFDRELPHAAGRYAFSWDDDLACSATARLAPRFADRGYRIERSLCLASRPEDVRPSAPPPGITIRPLGGDADWALATANQLDCRDLDDDPEHVTRRMQAARRAVAAGDGRWYAAFEGDRLVGDLGLFGRGPRRRFQAIGTSPDHRGRGIASALVAHAARQARQEVPGTRLVILTDIAGGARRLYERLGFAPVSVLGGALA